MRENPLGAVHRRGTEKSAGQRNFGKGSLLRNEPRYPTKGYAPQLHTAAEGGNFSFLRTATWPGVWANLSNKRRCPLPPRSFICHRRQCRRGRLRLPLLCLPSAMAYAAADANANEDDANGQTDDEDEEADVVLAAVVLAVLIEVEGEVAGDEEG